jgi:predicted secreted protein
MAQATTSTFGQFKILLGDGATPTEVFTPICGLTSKGINYETETNTVEVPDCTNEDQPAYKEEGAKSYSVSLTGSGMWAAQSHGILIDWWKTGNAKNIKVQYVQSETGDVEFVNGPAILKSLGSTVEKGGRLSADISIAFTAMPTFVDKT